MTIRADAEEVTLVGAGLAGPLLAIYLQQRGIKASIYERRADMRRVKMSAGRSINLAISARGIYALQEVGLWESMQGITVPMKGRMIHPVSGDLAFQPYGKDETEIIHSISRAELNIALLNAAEGSNIDIYFNERCTGINFAETALHFHNEETGHRHSLRAEAVIGTDGASSAIRLEMLKSGRFDFSQQYLSYGYKELTIPAGVNGEFRMEPNALHIWPRGSYMLIALPNIDGSFACILFLPYEGTEGFSNLTSQEEMKDFFLKCFPDALPLMPNLTKEFFENPTGSMVTIKCFPWVMQERSLLLGDSAHAIVPFFGQGLNCAFEDCTELMKCFDSYEKDWPKAFFKFQQARKPDTDAIADLALDNFIEMRDRVADPHFLF
jgi:kynurenine 3-monooxygenase